jgi:hypothetical protein
MVRGIAGVILGYVVMAGLVFTTFTAAYLAMGADRAFQPGSYDVSPVWIGVSFVLGLVAAVVGGLVCAMVSRSGKGPLVLAALVLVLGLAMAVPVLAASAGPPPSARTGDVANLDAMQMAKQPAWVALLNPLVGAVGVVVGSRLVRKSSPDRLAT